MHKWGGSTPVKTHVRQGEEREREMMHADVAVDDETDARRGVGEPGVTKATVVSRTRPAARRCSKDHWYEPCDLDGGRKVIELFAMPL